MATEPQRRLIPFKQWTLWTTTAGPGPGTPLVCIPGGPGMAHDYLVPLAGLSARRPVVFYDPLGAGRSTRQPPVEWTLPLLRDEVIHVCEALELPRVHLFAHSSGGLIALEAALAAPDRFAALVLASPPVSVPEHDGSVRRLIRALEPDDAAALERGEADPAARDDAYSRAYYTFAQRHVCRVKAHLHEALRRMGDNNLACHRALKGGLLLYTAALRDLDLRPRLSAIAHPTLLTGGGHDLISPEMLEETRALLPRAEIRVFEESSHTQHLEETEAYLTAVDSFLDRVEREG